MTRPPAPIDTSRYPGQVGARIRARRLKANLSVPAAAESAGVSAPAWYHWETLGPPLAKLPDIAAALGCSVRVLV